MKDIVHHTVYNIYWSYNWSDLIFHGTVNYQRDKSLDVYTDIVKQAVLSHQMTQDDFNRLEWWAMNRGLISI